MKKILLTLLLLLPVAFLLFAQAGKPDAHQQKAISSLIDQYSIAREKSDTGLLKSILTRDMDQLVSTGEWRMGIDAAVQGMLKSSGNRPGTRTLRIEYLRMINPASAIVDCRYEIRNTDGTTSKMWSSFIVVAEKKTWKISAIRNMLPTNP